jgi:TetR/AcrR family transcriptional repressor of nem operon
MDKGASQIIALLGDALEKGRQEGSLAFDGEALTLSQVLYSLWLGANLQAKLRVAQRRWKAPLPTPNRLLLRLRFNRRFYFISY